MSTLTLPEPGENLMQWAIDHPEDARRIVTFAAGLLTAEVRLIPPSANNRGPIAFLESESNLILALPLQLSAPIPSPTGGSTIDLQARSAIDALCAALRVTGMLPS